MPATRFGPVATYYLFVATQAAWFTTPIWNIFLLSKGLSFTQLGILNSAWWAANVLGELPTGYIGDRIGRRNGLVIGAFTHTVCVLVFGTLDTFWPILGIYTVWGVGVTFRSGSDSAWLYDTLEERADGDAFTRVKGRSTSISLATAAASSLLGGYLYGLDPYYPFLGAGIVTGIGALVVTTLPETEQYEADDTDPLTPREAAGVIRETLQNPDLRWFVPAIVALTVLAWTIGVFIQPVTEDVAIQYGVAGSRVPTLLGVLYAGFTGVSAIAAFYADRLQAALGIETWTKSAPGLLGVAYVGAALVPALAVPAFVLRSVVLEITGVFRSWYVNDRTGTLGRATVLSAVAMLLAVARIPVRIGVGVVADYTTELAAVGVVGATLLVLAVATRWTE